MSLKHKSKNVHQVGSVHLSGLFPFVEFLSLLLCLSSQFWILNWYVAVILPGGDRQKTLKLDSLIRFGTDPSQLQKTALHIFDSETRNFAIPIMKIGKILQTSFRLLELIVLLALGYLTSIHWLLNISGYMFHPAMCRIVIARTTQVIMFLFSFLSLIDPEIIIVI